MGRANSVNGYDAFVRTIDQNVDSFRRVFFRWRFGTTMIVKRQTRRRWHQISLGSILIAVTILAIALAYWRAVVLSYAPQRDAAKAIGDLGGKVGYESALPESLCWLPLADNANRAVSVDLQDCSFEEGSLALLADLPDVRLLVLARSSVTDKDLESVATLTKLERLSLWRTNLSNAGLVHLTGLTALRKIDIHANHAMDEAALDYLCHWPNLQCLIHDFPVTDRGLAVLAAHPNVVGAKLEARRVSDVGIRDLVRLHSLERLTVELECGRCNAEQLMQLRNLQRLDLIGRLDLRHVVRRSIARRQYRSHRVTDLPFSELADRWKDTAREFHVHWWGKGSPFRINIIQPDPAVTISAELTHHQVLEDLNPHERSDYQMEQRALWETVRRFENLETIWIEAEGFDPAHLETLRELPRLKWLRLRVPMSNDLMRELAPFTRLERLDLSAYDIRCPFRFDFDACDQLQSLVNLHTFSAAATQMSDRHLRFLSNCPRLRCVYLWDMAITRGTLENLASVSDVEELFFFRCRYLNCSDLDLLREFKHLRAGWIHGKRIVPLAVSHRLDEIPTVKMGPERRTLLLDGAILHREFWGLPDPNTFKTNVFRQPGYDE